MEALFSTQIDTTTFANVTISVFTIALFVLQWRQHLHAKHLAKVNHQLALYEKRLDIFFQIEDFLTHFMRDGRPCTNHAMQLRHNVRTAQFLFPARPLKFADKLAAKAFEHETHQLAWEPLRARAFANQRLTNEETVMRDTALEGMHAIESWYLTQIENARLQQEFAPYLKLPETV